METLNLAELIDPREELPPVWVAYPGSDTFEVLIRPLGSYHQEMVQQATEPRWNEALMQKKMELKNQ